MFCYQCEQHKAGYCDTDKGICGKDDTTAAMQDLLVYSARGIASYLVAARELGVTNRKAERFVLDALIATVTNVNFDAEDIHRQINESIEIREELKSQYVAAGGTKTFSGPATWSPAGDIPSLVSQNQFVNIADRTKGKGPDIVGLQEMLTYGLKGTAAYAEHAATLGYEDDQIYSDLIDGLDFLNNDEATVEELTTWSLKTGEINLRVMALLDKAHTDTYGKQVPTAVPITAVEGKAILVSGHDMKELQLLLEQTEGKGINIYTHGEMITGHAYPELKKYKHLIGNFGGAWQRQAIEFAQFPGAILMTTNCIQEPKETYKGRIFTTGPVAWPDVVHISKDRDFTPVIEAALAAEGFTATEPEKTIMVGFGHDAVLGVADTVVGAIKGGDLRHFFLIGGCDGAKAGRNYYTELAEQVPDDCVILTLACGKYRFNKLEYGDIGGIPRLLDMGQCNDAYSAIKVASALAEVFECGVNDLPLSLVLSWYEQKAVAVLLSLLHLGIKDIRLGPSLPAFVTEPVLNVLVENFAIKPITTPEEDLKAILG